MTRLLNLFLGLGYLYLIRSGSRYKIGIGIDAERRFRQVDESIPGSREHLVGCVRLFWVRAYETNLHRKFHRKRFRYIGTGATEWFRLNIIQVLQVKFWMSAYAFSQKAVLLMLLIISALLAHMAARIYFF